MDMDLKNIDFYDLCLEESPDFYGDICCLNKEVFNSWVKENLLELGSISSFDEVVPNDLFFKEILKLGYEHEYNQCHYSAKSLTILDEDYKYFTGFVKRETFPYPIITHSFNFAREKIIDFARITDPEYPDTIKDEDKGFPHVYYGIEIPRNFILNFRKETLEDKSMKPLLCEWFLECNNKI